MVIDTMTLQDVEQVAEIEKSVFSTPWSAQAFADTLTMEGVIFLVAREGKKVLGYCGIYLAADEGEVTNVAVHPEHRRKGIARTLLEKLLTSAGDRGAAHMILEVRQSNQAAIRLYESMGFEPCGVRKRFYRQPVEDALLMRGRTSNFH
ncbi:MAG: ribosomal protein S18-alanine N-acetyltransferase [Lachnospiraceae bacterium]|nr:ribosomal protein S18-alanine N-acetyltransferase [Lachnospiraceae bacterium]